MFCSVNTKRCMSVLLLAVFPLIANAAFWERYDSFSGAALDTSKWDVFDGSAKISQTGGAAKFETYPDMFDQSAWLKFKKDPDTIKGIKFRAMMKNDCPGDIRFRAATSAGQLDANNYAWVSATMRQRTDREQIQTGTSILSNAAEDWLYDLFWAQLPGGPSVDVTGKWITVSLLWYKPWKLEAWTNPTWGPQAGIKVKGVYPQNRLTPIANDKKHVGIGTRTRDDGGSGECKVWVDWVDVHRE